MDTLVARALERARSAETPGPDSPAGPPVTPWPGEPLPLPAPSAGEPDLGGFLRRSLAAGADLRFRPHASAGGRHPVNAHLLAGPGCPVPPGRYAYDPATHRLHRRGPAPPGAPPGAVVVFTVTARRTVSHYGHRAWPLLLLDTGHAVAALRLAAGRAPVAWDAGGPLLAAAAGLPEAPVWRRLWPRTEPEHPLAAVLLTRPGRRPPAAPLGRWARQGPGEPPLPSGGTAGVPLPAAQTEAERVLTALTARTPPGPERWDHRPLPSVAAASGEAAERRSATPPLPGMPAPDGLLTLLRTTEAAGAPDLRWCVAVGDPEPCLLHVAPGAPERGSGHAGALTRLAAGDARPALAAWAAGQAWVAGCGAVLLASGCPSGAGAGQVRRAHLRAGHAVQLAQAAAARLALASRPLGSWQRADLGAALGGPRRREWIVHGLALGAGRTERSTHRR